MNKYVDAFLSLNCATDVLEVTRPFNNMSKEISETYTIIRALKKMIPVEESCSYTALDLCAGNGLLGVTLAHLYKFDSVLALDKRVPDRNWSRVKGFSYRRVDITKFSAYGFHGKVLLANHPCKNASIIVDSFCNSTAKALVLMPCCQGRFGAEPEIISKKLGGYLSWCYSLYKLIEVHKIKTGEDIELRMFRDENCLSPKNIVITARRKEKGEDL